MTPQLPTISPQEFIGRWRDAGFGERQGAQTFFNDLCGLVGHPTPAAYRDPEAFTFEKAVPGGFADAYFEERFGWEFKGQDAQLDGAFDQLLRYQVHLKTPPLLIVSSFDTIRIQTNFPGMETARHDIAVVNLDQPDLLQLVSDAFFAPHRFRERLRSVDAVTRETAALFQSIVEDMETRNEDPERLARYLNQLVFCLYSEDAGLLPDGLFTRIVAQHYRNPATFDRAIQTLFAQMATGGFSGADEIAHFNGDLFNVIDTVELSTVALQRLGEACEKNWRDIEPSIFGTLFERALDASKRAQTGAHYTGADDIALVVEPVVMTPLRREWDTARAEIEALLEGETSESARQRLEAFRQRLASVTVLDPACGSGNFLYIALRSLLDLEREVIDFAAARGWYAIGGTPQDSLPMVQPDRMLGLEINHYAAELARTALWIGYIQWHQSNGFPYTQRPILTPLDTIRQTDAILDLTDPDHPTEPEWPPAEFIIGNPPFLGGRLLLSQFGDEYVKAIYGLYGKRIPNSSDLCCYWLEKARAQIENGNSSRVGLLATQGVRFQSNRTVMSRIKETGDIFEAYADMNWVLDGATVHISVVCFDDGSEDVRILDGEAVSQINIDLTAGADVTLARRLQENLDIAFRGIDKIGEFDIDEATALSMIEQPNPDGRSNRDVIKRWINGKDIAEHSRNVWIIDFGVNTREAEAALYEAPFEYVKEFVKPTRIKNRMKWRADNWWLHGSPASTMRQQLSSLPRYIATPKVSKHRFFVWVPADVLPSNLVIAIASEDGYMFGVLSSSIHELWARNVGSQLRESESGGTYTPTTCFQSFPVPHPTGEQREAIANAAAELDRLREGWLNPEGLSASELRRRTLTNLYNARPTWLDNTHRTLDAAVADAYGWPADLADAEILERLLALNLERADLTDNGS